MTCEVDLTKASIRFSSCESKSGLTNRERRALNREANILRRWLSPDARMLTRARFARIANRRRRALSGERLRKPTKREAREARCAYREQHTQPVQRRPNYEPPVLTEPMRLELIEARRQDGIRRLQAEKKRAWFERKHGDKPPQLLFQADELAKQIA